MDKKIWNYIEQQKLLEYGDKVIAGISGGADSVCLFFVLLSLREKLGLDILAVHVNHGLRGATAKRDEEFTKKLCEQHAVPCLVYSENIEAVAKERKKSIEEAGRIVRRECFESVRKEYQGNKIALAHHQNDNAETLIMNLARGTGLRGMGGIRPKNGHIIRPLLCLNRREIEAYLQEKGVSFCEDETNQEDIYLRNRIRHHIIPALEEQVNSQAVRHMNDLMQQVQEVWEYMDDVVQGVFKECVDESTNQCQIKEQQFCSLKIVLQKMIVYKALASITGSERDLSMLHVESVLDLFQKQSGKSKSLLKGIRAVRNYEGVLLEREEKGLVEEFPLQTLQIPGITRVETRGLEISCKIFEKNVDFSMEDIPQKAYTKWIDYDIIKNTLTIRGRKSQDVIGISRAGGTQKLKSYFVNEKIPAKIRANIPLIADGSQIVWVVGYRMSSKYQISDKTKRILQIEITEDKENGRNN